MKHLIRRKLRNLSIQMIERLFERAEELKLSKKDLFVLTSKSMIESRLKSYVLGLSFGEDLSIKSFVIDCQAIIDSLVISIEDPFSI